MNNEEESKGLLAASYAASARRIQLAIKGQLAICNSRKPNMPIGNVGEVTGLCGQSGRHPYFRIPVAVLEAALDRILCYAPVLAPADYSGMDGVIDEIAAACQELRQQTYFDAGTGCVNDQLPSMVPLLPPEEIWLDGRELPLDIWRLISFEFDLVSSAVSSEVSVEDFAFSAVNPSALAFRFLIGQLGNRRARFELQAKDIPSDWAPALATPLSIEFSLARLFFEAGSLLTPLAGQDFIKWYGAIRYLHWIDDAVSELRVKDQFRRDSVDSRYRGLFAEETAIGLMAIVLSDVFGAKPINNTVEVLPPGALRPNQPVADFVAQAINPSTSQPTTIIAESKGSLGKAISKTRWARAKTQIASTNAVFAGFAQTLPLAFGSAIWFSGQKGTTHCLVADPPIDSNVDSTELDPVRAWRVAYAKALRFVGLETAAKHVLHGEPAESIRPMDFDRTSDRRRSEQDFRRLHRAGAARHRFGMELLLDVGPCALSLDSNVANVLRHGIDADSRFKVAEVLHSRRVHARDRLPGASFETSLGLGCIFYSELDEGNDRGRRREPS
jgi:hypothetical protein